LRRNSIATSPGWNRPIVFLLLTSRRKYRYVTEVASAAVPAISSGVPRSTGTFVTASRCSSAVTPLPVIENLAFCAIELFRIGLPSRLVYVMSM
jgi:hypothetical protein